MIDNAFWSRENARLPQFQASADEYAPEIDFISDL
jgi:hypothetical protein